ncbi:TonB-linked SusC/RagA family outer membrane protein [Pedobacter africanus]|uniref:TonB-linked SusC/RagA family outer membrane protein n=1 Tax=Pedobacter africanus TaxID=151894 RepID=A0ACC6KVC9_9SPHI|nr:TonB-dependent receptor [Pedobacter africanus]MDR6783033.1 TonB-linked SusC/RagA family outer membrane protein [Pedobacter africanus]
MNKNIHCRPACEQRWLCIKKQIIMRIKIIVVLMTAAFLQVSANGFAQKITLAEKNASLEQLLSKIKKQSGYTLLYSPQLIKKTKPVSLNVTNEELIAVLEKCFEGQPLTFAINQNTIVVRKREEESHMSFLVLHFKLITGKVTDAKGLPVPGVTVKVKNKNTTRVTDNKGDFSIDVEDDDVLVFSFIGFKRKEIAVKGQQSLKVALEEDQSQLNDVVVIGYGEQSRLKTTSSISTVKGEQLENKPTATIEAMLQGLVPGLLVQNSSGMPGARSNIQVRGLAAVSRDANSNIVSPPLFVVDGVPMEQDNFDTSNPNQSLTSLLAGINPYDVESIDVLKDASATAIYGSRGANGVVMIKTKRGKAGKPIVNLNTQYGFSYYPELRSTLGGNAERAQKLKLWDMYQKATPAENPKNSYGNLPIELTDSLNSFYNNSTDWQGILFKNANFKNINLGISGGTENANYRIGADYYDEKGIVVGSGFTRYSLSYNGQFSPLPSLNISAQAILNQVDASAKRGSDNTASVIGNDFTSSLFPSPSSGYFTRFLDAYDKSVNLNLSRNIIAKLELNYDVFKWLSLVSRASAVYRFDRQRGFVPSLASSNGKPSASYYALENLKLVSETYLRLNHKIANAHTIDFVLGNAIDVTTTDYIRGSGTNGPSDAQQVIFGYPQTNISLLTSNTDYGMLSYYSRLSYDYKAKYILQAAIRTDGSSKFGKENRWGYFPSASAAWIFSKEPFFEKLSSRWFNFGKLRTSIGRAGRQYDDNYLSVGRYNANTTYGGVSILAPNYGGSNGIPLPNLTWESTINYGGGLDLEFFNGRVTSSVDYYYKKTDNFLFDDPLPTTSGYARRFINGGALSNKGLDLTFTIYTLPVNKAFQYNITLNASKNKNTLLKLPDFGRSISRGVTGAYLQVGRPLNGFYLLEYMGVYKSDDEVPINPYTGAKLRSIYKNVVGFGGAYQAGDAIFRDQNNDGLIRIDDDDYSDKIYMGDPNPKVYGGLNHSFRYATKSGAAWQLDVFMTYSIGNKVINQTLNDRFRSISWEGNGNLNFPSGQRNLVDISKYDIWTPENPDAKYPSINPWRKDQVNYDFIGNYVSNSSLFLEDGSFLRLRNISLSYDFPQNFIKKFKGRRLRVFASMDNVFLLTKYTGVDPENVDNFGKEQGNGYPIPKKFNFGLNFEL